MQNLLEIIKPIKLLKGSHEDTGNTGQGCFMNVIAYLNGEPQITDKSECVCFVIRPIAIWLNDFITDDERHRLLPFISRAMGSRTDDKVEIERRLALVVAFANKQAAYAAEYAEYAKYAAGYAKSAAEYAEYAKYAAGYAKSAAEYAEYAAEYAKYAAEYAKYAAEYAKYAKYFKRTTEDGLALMDALCPKTEEIEPIHLERAKNLATLCCT